MVVNFPFAPRCSFCAVALAGATWNLINGTMVEIGFTHNFLEKQGIILRSGIDKA